MTDKKICDFCDQPASPSQTTPQGEPQITIDSDGLWICSQCKPYIASKPFDQILYNQLDERLDKLVGQSAGAICLTLDLPYEPPYQSIIDAAADIAYNQDRFMSAWCFVTQALDGTTTWLAEDGSRTAVVTPDRTIRIYLQ